MTDLNDGYAKWLAMCDAYDATLATLIAKDGPLSVVLASAGNPDFGQDPRRSMPGVRRRTIRVASVKDASLACRLYIVRHELGGGNWIGGEVVEVASKQVVAQISFNGRAWKPGPYPQPEIVL